MVIEGVSFPSLNRLGSLGVPSTLAHLPMVLSHPTMLFKTQKLTYTLGPNCTEQTKNDQNYGLS
uniref:Uncharacterized protein n=1 Tax=Neogobius melanostomus TaxID=47308 RepID=A0A8C6TX71_9GOBI